MPDLNSAWRRLIGIEGTDERDTPMTGFVVRLLAVGAVLSIAVLAHVMFQLWPAVAAKTAEATPDMPNPPEPATAVGFFFGRLHLTLALQVAFLWLAVVMGALGGLVHAATSLGKHVGRRDFDAEWTIWYLLRPFVGAAVALIGYLVARGGLVGVSSETTLNPYGVAGIAAISGLFSRQAVDKLAEVVDVLFASATPTTPKHPPPPPPAGGAAAAPLAIPAVTVPSTTPGSDPAVLNLQTLQAGGAAEEAILAAEKAQLKETDKGTDAPGGMA